MQKLVLGLLLVTVSQIGYAQDDLLSLVDKNDTIKKERVTNAFKSSYVINGHSIEFLGKRIAFVADYHYIVKGLDKDIYKDPLSVGFDIETGGHVFQLHFSNATGMNEKAFITNTTGDWAKGEVRFGFNLSRVFTVRKPRH